MKDRVIYLLIGPKGSGKSFIGNLIEQEFGIKFIRVEDWAKQVKKNRAIDNQQYIKEVFEAIENGVRKSLESNDQIVFESTGLTNHFDQMVKNLRNQYTVITIGIEANKEICLTRFKSRDQTIHINVSDKEVDKINEKVRERNLSMDYTIVNEGKGKEELIHELRNILSRSGK